MLNTLTNHLFHIVGRQGLGKWIPPGPYTRVVDLPQHSGYMNILVFELIKISFLNTWTRGIYGP